MHSKSGPDSVLSDWFLGREPVRRTVLTHVGLAMLLMVGSVLTMLYLPLVGLAPFRLVGLWAAVSLGGLLCFFALIRSGWSRRFADPSLTLAQMVYAIACAAAAYAIAGPARGAVFPILMVILMFGMFHLEGRRVASAMVYALALFGVVMLVMAWQRPAVFVPAVEFGHFLMLAVLLPAVAVLAGRLARLRRRLLRQRHELSVALARNLELATRDPATGLINQGHMRDLLEQERQRCVRSGRTFCVAMLEIDHLEAIAVARGPLAADEVLRRFAREARSVVRMADVLSRWDDERFLLMLSDTRAPLARGGLERLRDRVAAIVIEHGGQAPLRITLSAGVTEHIAGQDTSQVVQRAQAALTEARTCGGGEVRLV